MGMIGNLFIIVLSGPKETIYLVLIYKGNNMGTEHVGTRGLVCSSEGLKILPEVCEGLQDPTLVNLCGIDCCHDHSPLISEGLSCK